MRIPGQARLVHMSKGSTHKSAALLGYSKNGVQNYKVLHNSVAETNVKRSSNTLQLS